MSTKTFCDRCGNQITSPNPAKIQLTDRRTSVSWDGTVSDVCDRCVESFHRWATTTDTDQ